MPNDKTKQLQDAIATNQKALEGHLRMAKQYEETLAVLRRCSKEEEEGKESADK